MRRGRDEGNVSRYILCYIVLMIFFYYCILGFLFLFLFLEFETFANVFPPSLGFFKGLEQFLF